jgi:hypothetical protein
MPINLQTGEITQLPTTSKHKITISPTTKQQPTVCTFAQEIEPNLYQCPLDPLCRVRCYAEICEICELGQQGYLVVEERVIEAPELLQMFD